MKHFKEFLLLRKGYSRNFIKYKEPLTADFIDGLTSDPKVRYLLSLDFANIRLAANHSTTTIDESPSSIFDLILYITYKLLSIPWLPFSRCLQSTLLILFIAYKIYFATKVREGHSVSLVEMSRFGAEVVTKRLANINVNFPASFKCLLNNPFKWVLDEWQFVQEKEQYNYGKTSCISVMVILKASKCLIRNGVCGPISFIPLFVIRALALKLVESRMHQFDSSKIELLTIGTVEPMQKLFATHVLMRGGKVCLLQHGIIYDSIGEYQIFSDVVSRGGYSPQVKLDLYHLNYYYYSYNVQREKHVNAFVQGADDKRINDANEFSVEEFPIIPQSILVFSSSYIEGMGYQTPYSLIYLLQFIRGAFHPDTDITIRLHPGESRFCILFLMLVSGIKLGKISFDDGISGGYDYAIGIPSTYYIEARKRTRKECLLFGPLSKFRINFDAKWIH